MYSVDEIIEQIDQESNIEDDLGASQKPAETLKNEAEGSIKVTLKPKRKRGSRPKLDAERLKGPRGLICMEQIFSDLKFKGQRYEKQDLHHVMNTLQLWCHRLFPKFKFDDCLTQLERLGKKRPVMTLKKKIILGMIEDLLPHNGPDLTDDVTESQQETLNDFDMLLNQEPLPTSFTAQPAVTAEVVELTEEQKETIARNRQLAAERRRARLEAKGIQEDSIIQSSQSLNLSEEQKLNIEKNRLLAIERRKQLQNKSNVHSENNSSQSSSLNISTNQENQTKTHLSQEMLSQNVDEASEQSNQMSQRNEPEMSFDPSQENNLEPVISSQNLEKASVQSIQKRNEIEMSQNFDETPEQLNQHPFEFEMSIDPSQGNNLESKMSPNLNKSPEQSIQVSQKRSEFELSVDLSQENNLEPVISSQNLEKASVQSIQKRNEIEMSQNFDETPEQLNQHPFESEMNIDPSQGNNLESEIMPQSDN